MPLALPSRLNPTREQQFAAHDFCETCNAQFVHQSPCPNIVMTIPYATQSLEIKKERLRNDTMTDAAISKALFVSYRRLKVHIMTKLKPSSFLRCPHVALSD